MGRSHGSTATNRATKGSCVLFCCSIVALHASIGLWISIWDNITYTGIGLYWCGDEVSPRIKDAQCVYPGLPLQATWVAVGTFLQIASATLAPNAGVRPPSPVWAGVSRIWLVHQSTPMRWLRAVLGYLGQVLSTCGMYNLLDAIDPWTWQRDVVFVIVGSLGCTLTVVIFDYHLKRRQRAVAPPADLQDLPLLASGSSALTKEEETAIGQPRPVAHFFRWSALSMVCSSLLAMTWVGMDNLLDEWAFGGPQRDGESWWNMPRVNANLVYMAVGLAGMGLTGTLPVYACIVEPSSRIEEKPRRSLAMIFLVELGGVLSYYIHLSGFWYILDEDFEESGLPMTTARNLLFLLFFVPLYLSGAFFGEAGLLDVPPSGLMVLAQRSI